MTVKLYNLQDKIDYDLSHNEFPAIVRTWRNSLELSATGTHFGFVYRGNPRLLRQSKASPTLQNKSEVESYTLHPGMYFCSPDSGSIAGESLGMVITYFNYRGMFTIGGAIESTGRFAYIDGGTNSLLIPPIISGDPCLNALYFPSGVNQTFHTHPSYRIGLVVAGKGEIITLQTTEILAPGTLFAISANHLHKFRTSNHNLTIVVFHPDSDVGFTHYNNPMLKRTIVDGVTAAEIPQIQTKLK